MSNDLAARSRGLAIGVVLMAEAGSYNWLWYVDILLAVGATLIHPPIRKAPRLSAAAASA